MSRDHWVPSSTFSIVKHSTGLLLICSGNNKMILKPFSVRNSVFWASYVSWQYLEKQDKKILILIVIVIIKKTCPWSCVTSPSITSCFLFLHLNFAVRPILKRILFFLFAWQWRPRLALRRFRHPWHLHLKVLTWKGSQVESEAKDNSNLDSLIQLKATPFLAHQATLPSQKHEIIELVGVSQRCGHAVHIYVCGWENLLLCCTVLHILKATFHLFGFVILPTCLSRSTITVEGSGTSLDKEVQQIKKIASSSNVRVSNSEFGTHNADFIFWC